MEEKTSSFFSFPFFLLFFPGHDNNKGKNFQIFSPFFYSFGDGLYLHFSRKGKRKLTQRVCDIHTTTYIWKSQVKSWLGLDLEWVFKTFPCLFSKHFTVFSSLCYPTKFSFLSSKSIMSFIFSNIPILKWLICLSFFPQPFLPKTFTPCHFLLVRLEEAASILGVSVDTPIETLKARYRQLALAWHPDKVGLLIFII